RLILHRAVYDEMVERVVERTRKVTVGDPADPANFMGAVIDEDAYRHIQMYMGIGRDEGRLLLGGGPVADSDRSRGDTGESESRRSPAGELPPGWFLQPTIFADVSPEARIAQEEI